MGILQLTSVSLIVTTAWAGVEDPLSDLQNPLVEKQDIIPYDPPLEDFKPFYRHRYMIEPSDIKGKTISGERRLAFQYFEDDSPEKKKTDFLLYLSPEVAFDEVKDLKAISQSKQDIDEIRGWQKLVRYYYEYRDARNLPARITHHYTDKEFQPIYHLMWNRIRLFDKTLDVLYTVRKAKGYPVDLLESLKDYSSYVLEYIYEDDGKYASHFDIRCLWPEFFFGSGLFCKLKIVETMLCHHLSGRKVDPSQIVDRHPDMRPDRTRIVPE